MNKEIIKKMEKVLHDRIIDKTWRAEKVARELYEIAVPKDSVMLTEEKLIEIIKEAYQQALKDKVVLTKEEYEKLTSRRFIITPKKPPSVVEQILKERNNPFIVVQDDMEITPIPSEKEIVEKILHKILSYVGSNQKFWLVDDESITIIDANNLFDFLYELSKQYGVDLEDGVEVEE